MTTAHRMIARTAGRTPVPRWVSGVFLGLSTTGIVATAVIFWVLYREAAHEHLTVEAAVALLAVAFILLSGAGIVAFMKVALPPVWAQAARLEETLAQQLVVNRRQQDFLVHVHHELRTPVTVVLGATQLLATRGDELDPHGRAQLRELAARNAEALSQLVEDLTVSVDHALPGMSFDGDVNNWSSPRSSRRREMRQAG